MDDVTTWLMDGDPAIRWQTMRDLTDAPAAEVAAERARVAQEGWGRELLDRHVDGQWAGGAYFPSRDWQIPAGVVGDPEGQPWVGTCPTLRVMCELGVDPAADAVRAALKGVGETARWEHDGQRFFDGEVEPCINGATVTIGAYFGQDVEGIVNRLLGEQLDDGGWNCEAENGSTRSSFHSTICVLEGLLAYERSGGGQLTVEARRRGEEYLLARGLMRRASNGEVVDDDWLSFSFPTHWHYDVLRGLDHFRSVGGPPDERLAEALELVRAKRQSDGRWLLENTHPGWMWFELEDGDERPSRWNTLRALRVLRWAEGAA